MQPYIPIIILFLALLGISATVVAFLKIPPSDRNLQKQGTKLSEATRNLALGLFFIVMGAGKIWLWSAGVANSFALWFGILLVLSGLYFAWDGWRSRSS